MKSIINVPKKSRGRPTVDSERVVVRVRRDELDALDLLAAEKGDISRPEAIRRILADWLKERGYLTNKED